MSEDSKDETPGKSALDVPDDDSSDGDAPEEAEATEPKKKDSARFSTKAARMKRLR